MPTFRYDDERELVDSNLDRQEALDRAQDRATERADAPPFAIDEAWARRELLEVSRLELEAPDQLAAYRLPDGTIDVDALELGHPTPGWLGVNLETVPNYATGRPPAPRRMIATGDGTFVLEDVDVVTPAAAHRPSLRELELAAAASLEASRARRQDRAGDVAWAVGLGILAVIALTAFALIALGLILQ